MKTHHKKTLTHYFDLLSQLMSLPDYPSKSPMLEGVMHGL